MAPRLSVIALSVHANVNIRIAGTMALKPSTRLDMLSLKLITLLARRKMIVMITAIDEPITRPTEASLLANALTKLSPEKNPPV